jgi:3-dehydroquinate dehydratase/shikimate dehydrogenase
MRSRLAVSLALPDTERSLATLNELASVIGLAEIRLDLMESYDLPRLIAESPCPLIITCRPPREGGRFAGSEAERLAILAQAMELGCAYVDVEWDSVTAIERRGTRTQVMASRHWYNTMPATFWTAYQELAPHVDVIKLVGTAATPADVLPVFELLHRATLPVVGIAMGEAGQISRVLAPCFPGCLLTYGAATAATITAPGQISIQEMVERYRLHQAGPQTAVHVHLCADAAATDSVVQQNTAADPTLHVPWIVTGDDLSRIVPGLRAFVPRLTLITDAALLDTQPPIDK